MLSLEKELKILVLKPEINSVSPLVAKTLIQKRIKFLIYFENPSNSLILWAVLWYRTDEGVYRGCFLKSEKRRSFLSVNSLELERQTHRIACFALRFAEFGPIVGSFSENSRGFARSVEFFSKHVCREWFYGVVHEGYPSVASRIVRPRLRLLGFGEKPKSFWRNCCSILC